MKRILLIALCIAAMHSATSCTDKGSSATVLNNTHSLAAMDEKADPLEEGTVLKADDSKIVDSEKEISETNDDFGFVIPADAVHPDLDKDDPSDNYIQFRYDELGRIKSYMYKVNGKKMLVCYTYNDKERTLLITAFSDDIVAVYETIDLPGTFDEEIGFRVKDGFYYKGYDL